MNDSIFSRLKIRASFCYVASNEERGGDMNQSVIKVKLVLVILGLSLATSVMPLSAHHSVESQYDVDRTLTIRGVVTKIEWTNPHARFWVDANNGDGTVSNWEMELPAPNALKYRNVRIDFVKQGDQVTVDLWRAKDGSRLAHALTVTTPDGRVLSFPRSWGTPPAK
jgi:diaminopimelate epimerase